MQQWCSWPLEILEYVLALSLRESKILPQMFILTRIHRVHKWGMIEIEKPIDFTRLQDHLFRS